MTTPYEFPELYQSIVLGESTSPGTVTLRGHERKKAWDVKKPKGSAGGSNKLNGDPVGKFVATFALTAEEYDEEWPAFKRVIESTTNGREPVALPVYHPDLAANYYTEVSLSAMGEVKRDDLGGVTIAVEFTEYAMLKPKAPRSPKPKSSSSSKKTSPKDPNAAYKRELASLLEQAREP